MRPKFDIYAEFADFKNIKNEPVKKQEFDYRTLLSSEEQEVEYLEQYKAGTIKEGLKTGYANLDEHFRFVPAHFVVINGHANIGKSTVAWYLAVIANVLHGWRWLLYTPENECQQVRRVLMEFKHGKSWKQFNNLEMEEATKWCYENFDIISNDKAFTAFQIIQTAKELHKENPYNAVLIDPYNSLDIDIKGAGCYSMDDYHNKVINSVKLMTKQTGIAIWINTHAYSAALRNTQNGMPSPPSVGDVEGGGKWNNRCDEFLTFHRYTQDPAACKFTEIHVRKFKDYDLGGSPTPYEYPIKLEMCGQKTHGWFGFFNESNECPLFGGKAPEQKEITTFDAYAGLPSDDDLPF